MDIDKLKAELKTSNEALSTMMARYQLIIEEKRDLERQVDLNESNTRAAVAQAKYDTMQHCMTSKVTPERVPSRANSHLNFSNLSSD